MEFDDNFSAQDVEEEDAPEADSEPAALNSDALLKKWIELGLLIDWVSNQSNKEVMSISDFVEEKAQELVGEFRTISKVAKEQSDTVNNIIETSTNVVIDGESTALVEVIDKLDQL